MKNAIGFIHSSGSPCVRVSIFGVYSQLAQEFDAIIDTGFTGFVSIPLIRAFPLGLPLFGTTTVTLADGSTSVRFTAFCTVALGGEMQSGLAILEVGSEDVLVGTEFLKRFGRGLFVHEDSVVLFDVDVFAQLIAGAQSERGRKEE